MRNFRLVGRLFVVALRGFAFRLWVRRECWSVCWLWLCSSRADWLVGFAGAD